MPAREQLCRTWNVAAAFGVSCARKVGGSPDLRAARSIQTLNDVLKERTGTCSCLTEVKYGLRHVGSFFLTVWSVCENDWLTDKAIAACCQLTGPVSQPASS